MSDEHSDQMLDLYLFETGQLTAQLEQIILSSEKADMYSSADIDEIFRIMHTIKGASAMMSFENIAGLAHSLEDVFFYLRDAKPQNADCEKLSDLILEGVDFVNGQFQKIKSGGKPDGDASALTRGVKAYLEALKKSNQVSPPMQEEAAAPVESQPHTITQDKPVFSGDISFFHLSVIFEEDCGMENIRAFTIIQGLQEIAADISYIPENILEDDAAADIIRRDGFQVFFATDRAPEEMREFLDKSILFGKFELTDSTGPSANKPVSRLKHIVLEDPPAKPADTVKALTGKDKKSAAAEHQSMISVNVKKLDRLMDLVGELVISEAMVTQNQDIKGLALKNFSKAVRQLEKVTDELQDTVMSMRMLPLAGTFHKMHRIVRDMCKKLGKEVDLKLVGEETEVDKNIIEQISDPLMHLIRNALDHGIESSEERKAAGKAPRGRITLGAKTEGSDVVIIITDDGRGLDRGKILSRARNHGLIHKPENELTDKEIYSFIFAPGFSTKEKVTEFSGRGVGMDVVVKNINSVGGIVLIDSVPGAGSTITLKVPLTMAIVDGIMLRVGNNCYALPTTAIKESFRPCANSIVVDPDGNEMILLRGQCYPILRIHKIFKVNTKITAFTDGIIIMVENESNTVCLFADELIGEQQVVVKSLPQYIKNMRQVDGLSGCTLLGDGGISLILDIGGLMKRAM